MATLLRCSVFMGAILLFRRPVAAKTMHLLSQTVWYLTLCTSKMFFILQKMTQSQRKTQLINLLTINRTVLKTQPERGNTTFFFARKKPKLHSCLRKGKERNRMILGKILGTRNRLFNLSFARRVIKIWRSLHLHKVQSFFLR